MVGLVLMTGTGVIGAAFAYRFYERVASDLPTVDGLKQYQPPVMSRIYARDERLIAELAKERRIFVPINAIPDVVKQAFVSAEDQKFWTHHGVDPSAILRAALTDLQQMGRNRRPIGASTITQQVARNMLLGSNERTLDRKVKEAILAMRVEDALPKERNPRTLPQRDLFRPAILWRGVRRADLFQQEPGRAHPCRRRLFSRPCPRRPTTTTRSASPKPPAPGGISCWIACWRITPSRRSRRWRRKPARS